MHAAAPVVPAAPAGDAAKLVSQAGVLGHTGEVQVEVGARRLLERVQPGEARTGGAATGSSGLQHRDVGPALRQPIGDVRPDAPSHDDDDVRAHWYRAPGDPTPNPSITPTMESLPHGIAMERGNRYLLPSPSQWGGAGGGACLRSWRTSGPSGSPRATYRSG